MSKISLKPNASGTGVFSLEAPNSNVDRTLNLPDEAGTVLTNVSDIESQVKTATNATGSAPVYACRAWANLMSNSINDSGNVSSITFNSSGNYTVNLTTPMPDSNYSVTGGMTNSNSDLYSECRIMGIHVVNESTIKIFCHRPDLEQTNNPDVPFFIAAFR